MTVYVALLRAIGPATHRRLSMAQLRAGCEAAGFGQVSTYIATGNVIFTTDTRAGEVRNAVQAIVDAHGLGGLCDAFVRTRRQLARLVRANPFPEAARERPDRVGVCFFQRRPRWPETVRGRPERIAAVADSLVIDYGPGDGSSTLQIERDTGLRMTQRNWNTVVHLLAKAEAVTG